ncbi:MAG: hypothetical protein COB40_10705 [Marinosulfonomonas sp.]|nr:MAG: hypothetical protein COB40_10705 [Marinosulfonomonas sp.]
MNSKEDHQNFKRSVASLISEELHLRRGMSVSEYTSVCRKAWDECQASPGFDMKVLIDPLTSASQILAKSSDEYVHWRVGDFIDLDTTQSMEITCEAIGAVRPDFSTALEEGTPLVDIEPEVPEAQRYLLGVFDVLGFSAWLEQEGLQAVEAVYEILMSDVASKESIRSVNVNRIGRDQLSTSFGMTPINHVHFSDTIILWVPLAQHFIAPFMARCADLVCDALKLSVPLRGTLAVGEAIMHKETSTFVGMPIVEAAKLEAAQDWLGVCLGPSMLAHDVSREFDPNFVLPFNVPFKKGRAGVVSGLALDWPRRYRERFGSSPKRSMDVIDKSPAHHKYYENAAEFIEFSADAVLRTDGFQGINLDQLVVKVLQARESNSSLSREDELSLRDLFRAGEDGARVSEFLTASVNDSDIPEVPSNLPSPIEQQLHLLKDAADGEASFFQLVPTLIEIVHSRFTGEPLQAEATATLNQLASVMGDGPSIANYLRNLAGGKKPRIPGNARPGIKSLLKDTRNWIEKREVPDPIISRVANDCIQIAVEPDGILPSSTSRALDTIKLTGEPWVEVADFLFSLMSHNDQAVPKMANKRLRAHLERIKIVAEPAGVQPLRIHDIIAVGIGDPPTELNLYALTKMLLASTERNEELPDEIEILISTFEASAPERKILADCLWAIGRGVELPSPPEPDDLPRAIYVALLQLHAFVDHKPIPLSPELLGLAVIHARFSSRKLGDCSLLSLTLLARAGQEFAAVAEYLLNVSKGQAASPAPQVTDPELARTVAEVRTLSMPQVGGIRMMLKKADPEIKIEDQASQQSAP